jgi:5-methylcytosine-specific restriction protein A
LRFAHVRVALARGRVNRANLSTVRLVSDDGRTLDAEFEVEPEHSHIAIVLSSRSGPSGSKPAQNPEYNAVLTLLLQRLGQLNAVLVDALVDSLNVHRLGLPESERRLIRTPVHLAAEPDMKALRLRMAAIQGRVGQAPNAPKGGTTTKRIRLRVDVPGYRPDDAARLATVLTAPIKAAGGMFILTWHPLVYHWDEHSYDEAIQQTAAGQPWSGKWTVGARRSGISPGDKAVIYRQHEQRGLVASGTFTSDIELGHHWDNPSRVAAYAQVSWDVVLDYENRLPLDILQTQIPEVKWIHLQGGGTPVPAQAVHRLNTLWDRHVDSVLFRSPDELRGLSDATFPEGAISREPVNRYERDPRARKACLEYHGFRCAVCKFSFEEHYGELGRSYIHVHHTMELSKVPPGYRVNPVTDLIPLCPNCHAMIHRPTGQALTVEELRQRLMS